MAVFRFAPRALLELGKELISSDEVALYELIKNSVDAGSRTIEIEAAVVLPQSAYAAALEALDDGVDIDEVLRILRSAVYVDAVPADRAGFLSKLEGAGSRRRLRSRLVAAYRRFNRLTVRDCGHGMSAEELETVFLTIGTRSRRRLNIEGAQFLGDKGVGRLATMRLGDYLTVTTTRAGDRHWTRLRIDWSLFSHDGTAELEDIDFKPVARARKEDRAVQGSEIEIGALAGDWSAERFEAVVGGSIARMVDPFQPGRGNRLLSARRNGKRVLVPSVPKALLDAAHAVLQAKLRFASDGTPILEGTIEYRLRDKSRVVAQRGVELYSIAQLSERRKGKRGHAAFATKPIAPKALRALGSIDVEIYWYNRLIVKAIEDLTDNRARTREAIAKWAGGPMLYRRGYRILPYGDPNDDWLDLDKNAFGQAGFKLNRQQVIGRVSVASSHLALGEQTNREGLVESEPFAALRLILMYLLHGEMRGLINEADRFELLSRRRAEEEASAFYQTQLIVEGALDDLRKTAASSQHPYIDRLGAAVRTLGEQCRSLVKSTVASVKETVDERDKFVHLAGIGLMTEFIFHELDRAVDHTLRAVSDSRGGSGDAILSNLEDQLATLRKRISAFDELGGERRQVKAPVNLADIVASVAASHANQFKRHGVVFSFSHPPGGMIVRANRGMVIQILENLVANSVYWLKLQKRYERDYVPRIEIDLDPALRCLSVEDNGPGVDPRRREAIFQPFVTSKPPGQGRGLGLYISNELAKWHGWRLELDEEVGRRREARCNMFVLDMDEGDGQP